MNDRFLFRAKRMDNGEWIDGCLTVMWGQLHIINPNDENTAYTIDETTICQCTGLKDKNGKLIWENDIVSCSGKLKVKWSKKYSSWCLETEKWAYQHFFGEACEPCDCEVIGNVFDNPDLMNRGGI